MAIPELPMTSEQAPTTIEKTTAIDTENNDDVRDYFLMNDDSQMNQPPQHPLPTLDCDQSSFMREIHHNRSMESQVVIPQKRHLSSVDQPAAPVDRPGTGYPGLNHLREVSEGQGQRRVTRPNGSTNSRQQTGIISQRAATMHNLQQKKRVMVPPGGRQGVGPGPARRPAPKPAPQVQTRPPRAVTDNSIDTVIILDDDEDEGISTIKRELAAAVGGEEQDLGLPPPQNVQHRPHHSQAQHKMQQQVRGMKLNPGHNSQHSRVVERVNSNEHYVRHPPSGSQGQPHRTPSGRSTVSQQPSMSVAPDATTGTTEGALANAVAQLSQQKGALEKKLQDTMHTLEAKSHTIEEMVHKNDELTTSIEEYKKKIEGMRTRYKEFEKFLDGLGNDYKMLNDQKTILTRRIDELDGYNRDLEAERQVLHDRVENALQNQRDWRDAERRYQELEREFHKLQAAHEAATKEISEKGMFLVEEKNRNVSLESQMIKERKTHEEVVKVLNGFKHELMENIKSLEAKLADMSSAKTDDMQLTYVLQLFYLIIC